MASRNLDYVIVGFVDSNYEMHFLEVHSQTTPEFLFRLLKESLAGAVYWLSPIEIFLGYIEKKRDSRDGLISLILSRDLNVKIDHDEFKIVFYDVNKDSSTNIVVKDGVENVVKEDFADVESTIIKMLLEFIYSVKKTIQSFSDDLKSMQDEDREIAENYLLAVLGPRMTQQEIPKILN
jgi:hypothetical protein